MASWVLLRGLLRESRHWGDFPARFARSAHVPAAATVVAPDLPGNGQLYREASPATIEAMVESYRARLAADGIAPPYRLLALSMGAMVAVAWAQRHPRELACCALLSTSLRPFSPFHRRLLPRNYPALLWTALSSEDALQRERRILALSSAEPGRHAAVVAEWARYRRECPVSARNALRQLLAAARFRALPQRPRIPMLLLAGAADRLVDPDCSHRIATQWKLPLALHPSAGHDLPLDAGDWVAATVSDYFSSSSSGW